MRVLREELDRQGMRDRQIIMTADGTFTCREVCKNLPERIDLIGRIRKDARLPNFDSNIDFILLKSSY